MTNAPDHIATRLRRVYVRGCINADSEDYAVNLTVRDAREAFEEIERLQELVQHLVRYTKVWGPGQLRIAGVDIIARASELVGDTEPQT